MAEINRNLWDRASNAWRRLVDTATVAWNTSTPGQASASVPNGGIGTTQLADGSVTTAKIGDNQVTNAKLADMVQATIKGRANGAGTGDPQDLTASQVIVVVSAGQLDAFTASANRWGVLTGVAGDGVMEVGRIIDFHNTDGSTADNSGRLRSDDAAGQLSWTLDTINIQNQGAAATPGLKIANTKVVGAQGAAVADASGGATIDSEARTAINTLLARLRTHGLIAT